MRETIYTIPISEVFEKKIGCPICEMRNILENRCIEYILGAAMMEPDVRIETNKQGFCKDHFALMLKKKNRLSLALMMESHLQEIIDETSKKTSLFSNSNSNSKLAEKADKLSKSCYVCSKIDWALSRMLSTIVKEYCDSSSFKNLFKDQETMCLPHLKELLSVGQSQMSKKQYPDFAFDATELSRKYLENLKTDISTFCKMFDYRNTGTDIGEAKTSIERAVSFLTSRKAD